MPPGPAIALLDIGDVPAALGALDALAKEAEVEILARGTVQPGRYLIFFGGGVEAVSRSFAKAQEASGEDFVDTVMLPYAEERLVPAILDGKVRWPFPGDTLGVLQNATPPTLLLAVDAALKNANVDLVQVRVADGMGGKAISLIWGESYDVEAALEYATEISADGVAPDFRTRIIRNADPEVVHAITGGTGFYKEWRG